MPLERLDISRLGTNGEVSRKITCLAGRVTVFRANSEAEFDIYRSAIAGWKTPERFSLLLDAQTFNPAKHFLIGFGEAYASERGNDTLKKILLESGIPASDIEAALLSFGLGGLADAPCKALSPAQERLLRILAATANPNQVSILYEPFEILPEMWREKAADILARFAWERKAIVIVVKTSSRPECWIENEHIARVQLERPRKRTIGFGADTADTAAFVAKVRQESAAFDLKALKQNPLKHVALTVRQKFIDSRLFGYSVVILTSVCASALYFSQFQPPDRIEISREISVQPEGSPTERSASSRNNSGNGSVQAKPNSTSGASERTKVTYVLDGYAPELKEAIVLAFTNPDEVMERRRAAISLLPTAPRQSPAVRNVHIEPETDYQPEPDPSMENPLDEMPLEARREEIRRRFLAAIQASQ